MNANVLHCLVSFTSSVMFVASVPALQELQRLIGGFSTTSVRKWIEAGGNTVDSIGFLVLETEPVAFGQYFVLLFFSFRSLSFIRCTT